MKDTVSSWQWALEQSGEQERDGELARRLRRDGTRAVLAGGDFAGCSVIPRWWEWLCTGMVSCDAAIDVLIERRLTETVGLAQAIIDEWA